MIDTLGLAGLDVVEHEGGDLIETATATFSPDARYRYLLSRRWGEGPLCLFIMLNPSTATHAVLDATVTRCRTRALATGHGGLLVANLFAWRSRDPDVLPDVEDPVGPCNDAVLAALADAHDVRTIVCAWGTDKHVGARGRQVVDLLRRHGATPQCLGVTKGGHPRHPLYVPMSQGFVPLP